MLDGDEYVLNGTKQWITNGGEAEIYTVIARTNKGDGHPRHLSAFIVEKGTPGLRPSARRRTRWASGRQRRAS